MLRTMQLVASNVQGGVVPDCGHYIAEERPDYLAKRILSFLMKKKNGSTDCCKGSHVLFSDLRLPSVTLKILRALLINHLILSLDRD